MPKPLNEYLDQILAGTRENRSEIDAIKGNVEDLSNVVNEMQLKAMRRPASAQRSARDVTEQLGTLMRGFYAASKGGSIERAYEDAGFTFAEVRAALNESTSTGGVYVIPTALADAIFSLDGVSGAWRAAGSQILQADTATVNIPSRTTDSTIYVTAEGVNTTESTPTFGNTAVTLEKLKSYCEMTEEVAQDSPFQLGRYVADHLLSRIEQKLDAQAFAVAATAVNTTYASSTASFDLFVKAAYKLPLAAMPSAVWVMRPEVFARVLTIKQNVDVTNSSEGNAALAGISIFDGRPTPTLLGKAVHFTDQIDGTNNSSSVFVGSFSRGAVLAEHSGGPIALIDPYSNSVGGTVRIFMQRRCKAAMPLPSCFARIVAFPHLT